MRVSQTDSDLRDVSRLDTHFFQEIPGFRRSFRRDFGRGQQFSSHSRGSRLYDRSVSKRGGQGEEVVHFAGHPIIGYLTNRLSEALPTVEPVAAAPRSDTLAVGGRLSHFWARWDSPTVQYILRWGLTWDWVGTPPPHQASWQPMSMTQVTRLEEPVNVVLEKGVIVRNQMSQIQFTGRIFSRLKPNGAYVYF